MKLQWDHMYLLQCELLCVGSTLDLSFKVDCQCTDTVVAYLSGGQMNTVMLDYLCIQFFIMKLISHFDLYFTLQHIQEVTTLLISNHCH